MAQKFFKGCESLCLSPYFQDQLVRASSSIALNLAEGWGKKTDRDREKYFTNALGSLRECQAILMLKAAKRADLLSQASELGAVLYVLTHRPRPKR